LSINKTSTADSIIKALQCWRFIQLSIQC